MRTLDAGREIQILLRNEDSGNEVLLQGIVTDTELEEKKKDRSDNLRY